MSDIPDMGRYADALASAIDAELPAWVRRCVAGVLSLQGISVTSEIENDCEEAGNLARDELRSRMRALLDADIDAQPTTPLALLRGAVSFPSSVLARAGAAPVARDEYDQSHFPDDLYDLTPANFSDIGPATADAGIAWGAAKAMNSKARHGGKVQP